MDARWLVILGGLLLAGCAWRPAHTSPRAGVDVHPIEVTTTYITARVHRFARGEYAIVEVCVSADGVIAATRVTQSSTDHAFDEAAMNWARQARYRPRLENGQPVYGCEQVRVEINPNPSPHVASGVDSALG